MRAKTRKPKGESTSASPAATADPPRRKPRRIPFESVFEDSFHPDNGEFSADAVWRIRGSGVMGSPEDAKWTARVVAQLESMGIEVERYGLSSPCNVDAFRLRAKFLDGGLWASTGTYWDAQKGAWIYGQAAMALLAVAMGFMNPEEAHERLGVRIMDLERMGV